MICTQYTGIKLIGFVLSLEIKIRFRSLGADLLRSQTLLESLLCPGDSVIRLIKAHGMNGDDLGSRLLASPWIFQIESRITGHDK